MTRNNASIANSIPFVQPRMASGSTTIPKSATATAPDVTPTIQ